jgi:hypothetical protein
MRDVTSGHVMQSASLEFNDPCPQKVSLFSHPCDDPLTFPCAATSDPPLAEPPQRCAQVCLLTCCPQLLHNFIYREVSFLSMLTHPMDALKLAVARDLVIAHTFCRHFFWYASAASHAPSDAVSLGSMS